MIISVRSVARSLVDLAVDLPLPRAAEVASVAVDLLVRDGRPGDLRRLPREVLRLLRGLGPVKVGLETPSAARQADVNTLTETIERSLNRPVALQATSVPSLFGGARLRVGDDRFDTSLSGALRNVATLFTPSL